MGKIQSEGKATFVKSGVFQETGNPFCGALVYGQYNEGFLILGIGPNEEATKVKSDVYATVASLRL